MNYKDIKDQVVHTTNRLWWVQHIIDYLPLGEYTKLREYVHSFQYVGVPALTCITRASMKDYSVHSVVVKGVPAFLFVLGGKRTLPGGGIEYDYSNYYPLNIQACKDVVEHLAITYIPYQVGAREPIRIQEVLEDQDIEDLSNYYGLEVVYGKGATNSGEVGTP